MGWTRDMKNILTAGCKVLCSLGRNHKTLKEVTSVKRHSVNWCFNRQEQKPNTHTRTCKLQTHTAFPLNLYIKTDNKLTTDHPASLMLGLKIAAYKRASYDNQQNWSTSQLQQQTSLPPSTGCNCWIMADYHPIEIIVLKPLSRIPNTAILKICPCKLQGKQAPSSAWQRPNSWPISQAG